MGFGDFISGLGSVGTLGLSDVAMGDPWLGGFTGSTRAVDASNRGFQQQQGAIRSGMEAGQSALRGAYDQGRAGLDPYAQGGGQAFRDYLGLIGAGSNDSDIKQQTNEAIAQANAGGATSGRLDSKWSAVAAGRALGAQLQAREQRKYDRLQAAMGFGANAAAQQGSMAGQYGQSLASMLGGGWNALAGSYGNQGQAAAQGARAGFGDLLGLGGVAAAGYGAYKR